MHIVVTLCGGLLDDVFLFSSDKGLDMFVKKWLNDHGFKTYKQYKRSSGDECEDDICIRLDVDLHINKSGDCKGMVTQKAWDYYYIKKYGEPK